MKNRIQARYPHASSGNCISEHKAREVLVYDHPTEKRCRVRPIDEAINPETDFKVINRRGQSFHLIAVDKCLLQDTDRARRCDCVVYNPRVVCFIELKGPKKKNLADHIKSGADQSTSCVSPLPGSSEKPLLAHPMRLKPLYRPVLTASSRT